MDARLKPVAVGVAAGVLLFVLPDGVGPIIVIAAALLAGVVLPEQPMTAAAFFLVPTIVVGAVRVLTEDAAPAAGALILALVTAVFFTAIFTHVGAGIALRRHQA